MARLLTSGFEMQSLTAGVEPQLSSNTRGSIDTGTILGGVASFKANPTATTATCTFRFTGTGTNLYARFYLYISTLPASTINIFEFGDSGFADQAGLRLDSAGHLQLYNYNSGSQIGSNSAALSTGQWYLVEVAQPRVSSGTSYAEAKLNGVSFASTTTASLFGGTVNEFRIGVNNGTTSPVLFFDDIALNDDAGSFQNTWCGAGRVIMLSPNAAGDSASWSIAGSSPAASNYQSVDEATPDDGVTINQSKTASQEDLFNVANSGIGSSDTVNVVHVGVRYAGGASSSNSQFKLEIEKTGSGTKTQSAAINPNATSYKTNANSQPTTYPLTTYQDPDSSNWTQTTLDSMQIGYIISTASTNFANISTVFVMVDYTPSASTPVSVTDSGSGSDSVGIVQLISVSGSGSGDDSGLSILASIPLSDSGSGSDASSILATMPLSDSGSGNDVISLLVSIALSDSGSATDAMALLLALALSDAGTGSDGVNILAQVPLNDSGNGNEAVNILVALSVSDSGIGSDIVAVLATIALLDYGHGAEGRTNLALDPSAEGGSVWNKGGTSANITYPSTDYAYSGLNSIKVVQDNSGSGTCYAYQDIPVTPGRTYYFSAYAKITSLSAGGLWIEVKSTDFSQTFGSSNNLASVADWTRLSGSFTVPNGVTTARMILDSFGGAELTGYWDGVLFEADSQLDPYFDGDSLGASWTPTQYTTPSFLPYGAPVVLSAIGVTDSGVGSEAINLLINLAVNDSGSATEALNILAILAQSDSGSGSDALAVLVQIALSDSVVGTEALNLLIQLALSDSGTASDIISLLIFLEQDDSGNASEVLTVLAMLGVNDAGNESDTIAIQTDVEIDDTGNATDATSIGVQTEVDDTGTGSENVNILAGIPVSDSGSGTDTTQVQSSVGVADNGNGNEQLNISNEVGVSDSGVGVDAVGLVWLLFIQDSAHATDVFTFIKGIGLFVRNSNLGRSARNLYKRIANTLYNTPGSTSTRKGKLFNKRP